jgi:thioredoxin-like negative regulator of GroEL
VRVVKVDAYQHPELATRFGLFGIPAFVLFKGGRKLGMMRQYHGREYWRRVVAEQA